MEEIGSSTTLDPKPGYVLKTRVFKSTTTIGGTKVFVNVCHDPQVPKPLQEFDPNIVFPLIVANQWEIPIILSAEKEVKDKKGNISLCYDCCINETCFRWCMINGDLKSILNEWCLEAIELLYNLILDRQYSTPKMLSKGPLSKTEIRQNDLVGNALLEKIEELKANETLGIIEDLKDDYLDNEEISIFNRGAHKKPLIEELDTPIKTTLKSKSSQSFSPIEINYSVSFQKLQDPNGLFHQVTKIKSTLPFEHAQLSYEFTDLVLTSKSPQYLFNLNPKASHIKIPLDSDACNFKCFYVDDELFVFS